MKKSVIIGIVGLIIILGVVGYIYFSGEKFVVEDEEWFQTGNTQEITEFQTKESEELEDNRIGIYFSNLWVPELYAFPDGVLGADHILELGMKQVRLAINTLDSNNQYCPIYWNKSEFSIEPNHDDLITGLADNNIIMTYVLSFWDTDYVAQGGEVKYPRFKTEEEIQHYLDYVQFIVHHFKDRIQYYEIWNEPNIENTLQWIEVEDYINLVKRAVPIIKEEYPNAKIVVGSTSELSDEGSQNYLFNILESEEIMPLVDVIAWHPMYGTSPSYNEEYYYNYQSLIQEIKNMASAHGFEGEYKGDELNWGTLDQADIDHPGSAYSETISAKYYTRGIVMHLGMDVSTSVFLPYEGHYMQIVHTVQNLCTVMEGAKSTDLLIEIQSQATNIKHYTFSLSNGDKLIALWIDDIAVNDDPGVTTDLTSSELIGKEVTAIDVLNGYQQNLIVEENMINGLIVRDYPLILRIK